MYILVDWVVLTTLQWIRVSVFCCILQIHIIFIFQLNLSKARKISKNEMLIFFKKIITVR